MKLRYISAAAIAAATVIMGTTSCSDSFLDEKVFSSYPTNTDAPENLALGLYRQYAALWGQSGSQGFLSSFQVGTDVCTPAQVQGVEIAMYRYNELNEENGTVSVLWEKLYEMIANANLLIANEEAKGDGAAKRNVAEAKFFRAYCYDQLVTYWGGVPLETEKNIDNPRTDYKRNTVEEVNKQIVSDLEYALANLPEMEDVKTGTRVSKDAARQLAGQVYLRIGMTDNSYYAKAESVLSDIIDSGKYQLVESRYGVNAGGQGDYFNDMFRKGNIRYSQGNTEAIWTFDLDYNKEVIGGYIDNPQHRRVWVAAYYNAPGMQNADSLGGRGIARLRLSNFVKYGLYAEGDVRNSNYNIRRTLYLNKPNYNEKFGLRTIKGVKGINENTKWRIPAEIQEKDANGKPVFNADGSKKMIPNPNAEEFVTLKTGDKYIPAYTDSLSVFPVYSTKWGQYDTDDDFGYAMVKDWPLMRLGETYLLRAEARFRQGNLNGAAEDINKLRDRAFKDYRAAGHPNAGKVNASEITLDFILDERARELIGEESRRYTLVRTHTLGERIKLNTDVHTCLYAMDADGAHQPKDDGKDDSKGIVGFTDNNYLWPLPLNDIQLNKDAVLDQNPGYE